jgi:Ca2+-binding RTX toxin-like protein
VADFTLNPSNLDVTGTDGDDTFFASAEGDFRISGGAGFDTIDYSQLDVGITLNAPGTIDKGTLGTDTSRTNERIIAPLGQINTLDGTTNGGIPDPNVSIQPIVIIDLSKNALTSGTSPTSLRTFEVVNFNRVIGSNNDDTIVGNDLGNELSGGSGSDLITGGQDADILTGANSAVRGVGEVDTLTGGGGKDTFVIGDSNGIFYVGQGDNDYVNIEDFNLNQDRLDVRASQGILSAQFDVDLSNNEISAVDLFSNQSGNKDLIAKVKFAEPIDLSSLYEGSEVTGGCSQMQGQSFGMENKSWLNGASTIAGLKSESSFSYESRVKL